MLNQFIKRYGSDATVGLVLVMAAVLAMIMANTSLNQLYQDVLNVPIKLYLGDFKIVKPLILWINDGLMAIFFFLVGLEVKREIRIGHLRSREQVMLPGIAAIAGIAVPALIYYFINVDAGDPINIKGWAIPAATDIAFALGIFGFFSKTLPVTCKLFLLSVAIFDDIGAILIIAIFYSTDVSTTSLIVASVCLVVLYIMNTMTVKSVGMYMIVGTIMWAAVLKSGVHATLAGFLLAFFIPLKVNDRDHPQLLRHLEHKLHPWVGFLVLPIFAFANAGVTLVGTTMDQIFNPIVFGIAAGLFIGKQLGIFTAAWLAVKLRIASLPNGVTWLHMYGLSILCGIGFTMSLFIGGLAFEGKPDDYLNSVKVGVLGGSIISAILGAYVLSIVAKRSSK